jgi:hypothetical protein
LEVLIDVKRQEDRTVIGKIAFNLGRNDEAPNIDLAAELANTENRERHHP